MKRWFSFATRLSFVMVAWGSLAWGGDKFSETLDVSSHLAMRVIDGKNAAFSTPDKLSSRGVGGLQWSNRTAFVGLEQRIGIQLGGIRFGVGTGLLNGTGTAMTLGGQSVDVHQGSHWDVPIFADLGWSIGNPHGVRPYVAVGVSYDYWWVKGQWEGTAFDTKGWVFGVQGKVGALVWINEYFFADVGGTVGIVGAIPFGASIGLGLPIPLSNL